MIKLNYPKPRYDIIFHLSPKLKPVDDGVRLPEHLTESWRLEADAMIKAINQIFKPASISEVEATSQTARVKHCINIIRSYINNQPKGVNHGEQA